MGKLRVAELVVVWCLEEGWQHWKGVKSLKIDGSGTVFFNEI